LINNLSYVLVLSAAQDIAQSLGARSLLGLLQWANVLCGLPVRLYNGYMLNNISTRIRIALVSALFALSAISLGLLVQVSFPGTIAAILVVGTASSLGEAVVLAHLRNIDSRLTGDWASGTGMAGVAGSLGYLLSTAVLGLSTSTVFFSTAPLAIVYWIAFIVTQRGEDEDEGKQPLNDPIVEEEEVEEEESVWRRSVRVFSGIQSMGIQLALVYFLEYVVSVGFAARSNPDPLNSSFWSRNCYRALATSYQLGVLISRSSLSCIRIHRLYLLTSIQGVNFVLWAVHAYTYILPLWSLFPLMVFVGLVGGAMYVNVFFELLSSSSITRSKDRELAVNLVCALYNLGIIISAVLELVLDAET
jgi:battenin